MIILHASAIGSTLTLWAESTHTLLVETPTKRPKRSTAKTAPSKLAELPFAATTDELRDALQTIGILNPNIGKLALWTPTTNDGLAVPSSPLLGVIIDPASSLALSAWRVAVCDLDPAQAVDLLSACVGRDNLAPGIFVGASLAAWTAAFRLAASLVARGQYLPALRATGDVWEARWEPVIAADDATRVARLADAMPAACRAMGLEGQPAPSTPINHTLRAVVAALCDQMVRSAPLNAEHAIPFAALPPARRKKLTATDAWVAALRSDDAVVHGDDDDIAKLSRELVQWARSVNAFTAAAFKFCVRLEEPLELTASDDASRSEPVWNVDFLLQAADDPSLQINAAEVWRAKPAAMKLVERPGFEPRKFLLMALGHAAQLCPPIDRALESEEPVGVQLSTADAFTLLVEYAPALEQAGFGVMLPAWWTKRGTRLRIKAKGKARSPKMQAAGKLSLASVVEFEYEIALGDETMTRKQLDDLARQKSPLVQVRGQWVQVDQAEIKAAIAYLAKKSKETVTLADIMRMSLGQGESGVAGLEFGGVAADGWVGDFLAQLAGDKAFAELPVPDGVDATLRPYQQRGYSWMEFLTQWGLGACLADDMGLGKTLQVLALIRGRWDTGETRQPTLVVCPTSVIGNWQREAARFVPGLPVMAHHGSDRMKAETFAETASTHAIVLTSYALLHRDIDALAAVPWAALVLDEAQNIKNSETKQSRAARTLSASTRIALTGTPVENHVGDLWSIMDYLNPGLLGKRADFKRNYFNPVQSGDAQALERLKRLTTPFILRRMKTDKSIIADLPDKLEMPVYCTLTREQASLYQAVVKDAEDALAGTDGIQRRGLILATLSKLKQVCNHPAQFLHDGSAIPGRSGKLARLTEMLEEALDVGDKALIFSQFAEMGGMIQRHLQETFGHEVLFLHGSVDKRKRDEMVQRFQSGDGGPKIFVLSLKAGGVGLNLTAANHVFHFDRWWNPAVENQATDRAFRIGQKKAVQVHKFTCAGTLEEKIDDMIRDKQKVADQIVGAGEDWLTELSTDQLRDLFALGPEAVE
ncbi:MAG TPA: DEAD/DEAH box helicase [Capsulimonadaceae bacterium]